MLAWTIYSSFIGVVVLMLLPKSNAQAARSVALVGAGTHGHTRVARIAAPEAVPVARLADASAVLGDADAVAPAALGNLIFPVMTEGKRVKKFSKVKWLKPMRFNDSPF